MAPGKISTSVPVPVPNTQVKHATHSMGKSRRKSIIRIKPNKVTEVIKVQINHGDAPFTIDELKLKWAAYTSKMKKSLGGFSASILANCTPELTKDKVTVHLIFRNETNELEFTRLSLNLLEYLKSALKNNHIAFTTEVNQEKAKKILYTNREKFTHFSEEHPKLLEWEQKLGLELK